jgi:hypothetical protein
MPNGAVLRRALGFVLRGGQSARFAGALKIVLKLLTDV